MFFHDGNAHYDQCLDGRLRLVPDDDQLPALQSDYAAMRRARFVRDDAPQFDQLMAAIATIETETNQLP